MELDGLYRRLHDRNINIKIKGGEKVWKDNLHIKIGKELTVISQKFESAFEIHNKDMIGIELEPAPQFQIMVNNTYELIRSTRNYIVQYKNQFCTGAPPYEAVYKVDDSFYIIFFQNMSKSNWRLRCKILKENMTVDEAKKIISKIIDDYGIYLKTNQESMIKKGKNSLNDVILPKHLKQDILSDFDNFLKSREKYENLNMAWKRGYIFSGPPGNGKTLLLQKLSAAYGLKLYNILDNIDDYGKIKMPYKWVDKELYEEDIMGLNIHELATDKVKDTPPNIYYLEDMDKVIGKNENDYAKITLSDFLTAIDGVKDLADGIIIIGTTNNKDSLEKSILGRPGRFERIFDIELPGFNEIMEFFNHKKFTITSKKITERYANKLLDSKMSMAFVEEFVLSCITRDSKTKEDADEIFDYLVKYNKIEKQTTQVGYHVS